MTDFALKALEFGVLGLCAITLLMVWRIISAEQGREGSPRNGILQAAYFFMAFSISLALINGYVQLQEPAGDADSTADVMELQARLRQREDQLLQIRSAAGPILNARTNILDRLPPGPARDTLQDLVESLRTVLSDEQNTR
jgi:hypothetical protein